MEEDEINEAKILLKLKETILDIALPFSRSVFNRKKKVQTGFLLSEKTVSKNIFSNFLKSKITLFFANFSFEAFACCLFLDNLRNFNIK